MRTMRLPEPSSLGLVGIGVAVAACVFAGFRLRRPDRNAFKQLAVLWIGKGGLKCRLLKGAGYYKLTLTKFGREIKSAAFYREMQARDVAKMWHLALAPAQ
jgi:hypothetical protein